MCVHVRAGGGRLQRGGVYYMSLFGKILQKLSHNVHIPQARNASRVLQSKESQLAILKTSAEIQAAALKP